MLSSDTKRKTGPTSLASNDIVVGLEDLSPAVFPPSCIGELFTFSPFGLCCRQCEKQVQIKFDERSIRDHLKKHCMDSRMSRVRSILFGFNEQVNIARATGKIDLYRIDDKTYIGFLCLCGQSFARKDNALRHCKTLHCDDSQLQKIELMKLCCG